MRAFRKFALGKRRHVPGQMNRTEEQYAAHLHARKAIGEIEEFWFEAFTFKIGPDVRYTPDFVVMLPDGLMQVHEVKGCKKKIAKNGAEYYVPYAEGDALVKVRTFSGSFPFPTRIVFPAPTGGWAEVEI